MINEIPPSHQLPEQKFPYIDDNGVWISLHPNALVASKKPTPALFLDRDGVINVDVNYLSRVEDVVLHEGAATMIAAANKASIPVIVITNQSGVGRGYFDWDTLEAVQNEIARQLEVSSTPVPVSSLLNPPITPPIKPHWDCVYACPYHKDGVAPYTFDNHPFRKPNPGMLNLASTHFNIDLAKSWVIGDKADDVKAGINAGLRGGIHVGTRFKEAEIERQKTIELSAPNFTVMTVSSVLEACNVLPLLKTD